MSLRKIFGIVSIALVFGATLLLAGEVLFAQASEPYVDTDKTHLRRGQTLNMEGYNFTPNASVTAYVGEHTGPTTALACDFSGMTSWKTGDVDSDGEFSLSAVMTKSVFSAGAATYLLCAKDNADPAKSTSHGDLIYARGSLALTRQYPTKGDSITVTLRDPEYDLGHLCISLSNQRTCYDPDPESAPNNNITGVVEGTDDNGDATYTFDIPKNLSGSGQASITASNHDGNDIASHSMHIYNNAATISLSASSGSYGSSISVEGSRFRSKETATLYVKPSKGLTARTCADLKSSEFAVALATATVGQNRSVEFSDVAVDSSSFSPGNNYLCIADGDYPKARQSPIATFTIAGDLVSDTSDIQRGDTISVTARNFTEDSTVSLYAQQHDPAPADCSGILSDGTNIGSGVADGRSSAEGLGSAEISVNVTYANFSDGAGDYYICATDDEDSPIASSVPIYRTLVSGLAISRKAPSVGDTVRIITTDYDDDAGKIELDFAPYLNEWTSDDSDEDDFSVTIDTDPVSGDPRYSFTAFIPTEDTSYRNVALEIYNEYQRSLGSASMYFFEDDATLTLSDYIVSAGDSVTVSGSNYRWGQMATLYGVAASSAPSNCQSIMNNDSVIQIGSSPVSSSEDVAFDFTVDPTKFGDDGTYYVCLADGSRSEGRQSSVASLQYSEFPAESPVSPVGGGSQIGALWSVESSAYAPTIGESITLTVENLSIELVRIDFINGDVYFWWTNDDDDENDLVEVTVGEDDDENYTYTMDAPTMGLSELLETTEIKLYRDYTSSTLDIDDMQIFASDETIEAEFVSDNGTTTLIADGENFRPGKTARLYLLTAETAPTACNAIFNDDDAVELASATVDSDGEAEFSGVGVDDFSETTGENHICIADGSVKNGRQSAALTLGDMP